MIIFLKKIRDVSINIIKISYLYIRLYKRKFLRFFQRFFSRLIQTWYIGFALILLYTIITCTFFRIGLIETYMAFVPSLISTIFTIYLIDFLRIEFERRRDVNRRYLFTLELYMLSGSIERVLKNIFKVPEIHEVTDSELQKILWNDAAFWQRDVAYRNSFTGETEQEKRDVHLINVLNNAEIKCNSFIASYMNLANYEEYKLIHNFKRMIEFSSAKNAKGQFHRLDIEGMSRFVLELLLFCEGMNDIHLYWYRDNDIIQEIRERKIRIPKIIKSEYEQKSLAS